MQAELWQITRIPVAHSLSLHAGSDPVACQCNITDARPAVERRLDDADRTGAAEMPSGLSDSESPNRTKPSHVAFGSECNDGPGLCSWSSARCSYSQADTRKVAHNPLAKRVARTAPSVVSTLIHML